MRDNLLGKQIGHTQGLTALYEKTIPDIDNIPPALQQASQFINAESFAVRLITLPLYADLKDIAISNSLINNAC